MKQLNWYQIFGNTHKIPDGRTVTPTDDIQIWLHCANIWDKTYTTLYEVLNDTATLSALMASDNAVDYLVRSTSWAVPISVPVMTSNTTPSGVCIASSEMYPAYYAFNGNTNNEWASATVGTSNLGRIGYEFTEAVDIKKVSLFHSNSANFTCKVQYSDDGVNWTDVEDSTFAAVKNTQANVSFDAGSHLYWAVYYLSASASTRASASELQFYSASITTSADAMTYIGQNNYCANTLLADATWCEAICNSEYFESVLNVKVPTMTSNTTPSGECYSYYPDTRPQYAAYKAFDNDSTTWAAFVTHTPINEVGFGYGFTKPVRLVAFSLSVPSFAVGRATKVSIKGSSDKSVWTKLATYNNPSTADGLRHLIDVPLSEYQYFAFFIEALGSGYTTGSLNFDAAQFYGRKDV